MHVFSKQPIALAISCVLLASPCLADEVTDMSALPKDEFLDVYAEQYMSMLHMTKQLILRVNPDQPDVVDVDTPLSQDERDVFACSYDVHAKADAIPSMAQAVQATDILKQRYDAEPDFSYADVLFDQTFAETLVPDNPEVMMAAMTECGGHTMTANRMTLTPEFWASLQQVAKERGYDVE